jgi:hypothetical protein
MTEHGLCPVRDTIHAPGTHKWCLAYEGRSADLSGRNAEPSFTACQAEVGSRSEERPLTCLI